MKNTYGALDRLLHRFAFAHPAVQRALGDVENDMFRARLDGVDVHEPTFVTGLPRAGTTLVLELLHRAGGFASFTYRHMPFVLNPLLWDRVSKGSRREAVSVERAHGDGMQVSFDSPEAFEEVLWLAQLRARIVAADHLEPLDAADVDEAFRTAFTSLVRKLVALERHGDDPAPRYLSKNNANVARLPALPAVFPDAVVLCCFRTPATHVVSLDAQHRNFLALHADDAFARRYMAWIGHHDFGANFLPIRVGETRAAPVRADLAFWMRYWIDVYRHALEAAPPHVRFVDYDALLADGGAGLERLADAARLAPEARARLVAQADTLRAPGSRPAAPDSLPRALVAEAAEVHEALVRRAGAGPDD